MGKTKKDKDKFYNKEEYKKKEKLSTKNKKKFIKYLDLDNEDKDNKKSR